MTAQILNQSATRSDQSLVSSSIDLIVYFFEAVLVQIPTCQFTRIPTAKFERVVFLREVFECHNNKSLLFFLSPSDKGLPGWVHFCLRTNFSFWRRKKCIFLFEGEKKSIFLFKGEKKYIFLFEGDKKSFYFISEHDECGI